jgi:hypothetical protein
MADADVVAYNVAVFISTLFLLEFGADKFIDHTAIVARRTGISQTIIGLVTAGAEWEEVGRSVCTDHCIHLLTLFGSSLSSSHLLHEVAHP